MDGKKGLPRHGPLVRVGGFLSSRGLIHSLHSVESSEGGAVISQIVILAANSISELRKAGARVGG